MAATKERPELIELDTSDVERWIGRPVGGTQLKEPIAVNDIRRWAQGMQNPNPLYYDEDHAAESALGRIVAPASFAVCCDTGHGALPAIQGTIPGSHMLFGGDEWWFFGPRIEPGDRIRVERSCYDYRLTDTSFAGPTVFQRGDTTYINQRGEPVAKQRSTSIRYIVENAHRLNAFAGAEQAPEWSDEELAQIERERNAYYATFQGHPVRVAASVKKGEALPRGVIGPHTLTSMTTEWRSYLFTVWGSHRPDDLPSSVEEAGWLDEMDMSADSESPVEDPGKGDGLTHGPSRGHVQPRFARLIGMPRAYGYGASMGAWVLDYVANWAGERGFVTHSAVQYRNPALEGDVTYLDASVSSIEPDRYHPGHSLVGIDLVMTTQTGEVMAKGPVEVRVPTEA